LNSTTSGDQAWYAATDTDVDYYLQFYVKTANLNDYSSTTFVSSNGSSATQYHNAMNVRFVDDTGGGTGLKIYLADSASSLSTNYFNVTEGDTLRIGVHMSLNGGTSEMKVWRWGGSSWDAVLDDGAADYVIEKTSSAYTNNGLIISDQYTASSTIVFYIDDIQVDLDAEDWLPERVCN
jgi:hypothetical protein